MKLGLPSGFFPLARDSSSSSFRNCRACFSSRATSNLWTVLEDGPRCCSIVLSSFSRLNSSEYLSLFLFTGVDTLRFLLRVGSALITGNSFGSKLTSKWSYGTVLRLTISYLAEPEQPDSESESSAVTSEIREVWAELRLSGSGFFYFWGSGTFGSKTSVSDFIREGRSVQDWLIIEYF